MSTVTPEGGEFGAQGDVRADRGGIAAGRDVLAQHIITGDFATVLSGDYVQLEDAYIDPGEVFELTDVDKFIGRQWLIEKIDNFIAANDRGWIVIEAHAGLGKTALIAHLVRSRGYIHNFCELTPGELGIESARLNLAAQSSGPSAPTGRPRSLLRHSRRAPPPAPTTSVVYCVSLQPQHTRRNLLSLQSTRSIWLQRDPERTCWGCRVSSPSGYMSSQRSARRPSPSSRRARS